MCCSSQVAHVLSNSWFLTGNHCTSRCHWPNRLTQVLGGCIFSAHHRSHAQSPPCPSSSPLPQDGFLMCCKSVPCLVFLQKFPPAPAQLLGRDPCSYSLLDQPTFPSSYCLEEIRSLLLRRVRCFKTVCIPKWNKTKAEFSLQTGI